MVYIPIDRLEPVSPRENFPQLEAYQRLIIRQKIQEAANLVLQNHKSIREGKGEIEYNKGVAELLKLNLEGYSETGITIIAPLTLSIVNATSPHRLDDELTPLENSFIEYYRRVSIPETEAIKEIQALEEQVKEALKRKAAELDQAQLEILDPLTH